MRQFYTVQTATLAATPPVARWHAAQCPGAPQWSLVVVEEWLTPTAEDDWELLATVTEHYPENWGGPVPPQMVTAFAPWGVVSTDTIRGAMRKIRARWPAARL